MIITYKQLVHSDIHVLYMAVLPEQFNPSTDGLSANSDHHRYSDLGLEAGNSSENKCNHIQV